MAQLLDSIAQKLSRLFLGRICVRRVELLREQKTTAISSHHRIIEVTPVRTQPRVDAARFIQWRDTKAKSAGSLLGKLGKIKVKKRVFRLKGGTMGRVSLGFKRAGRVRNGLMKIANLPIYRKNRLNFIKNPPKIDRATILALFSPIIGDRVARTILDKSSGNLLVWYQKKRIGGQPQQLLLVRVFGAKEPLQWIWLPSEKKLS